MDLESNETTRQRWWSVREQQEIWDSSLNVVESSLDKVAEELWERQSYCSTLTQIHEACMEYENNGEEFLLSEALQRDLSYWMHLGPSHRGLERCIASEVRQFQQQRKDLLWGAVVLVQDTSFERQLTEDQSTALVRKVSEAITSPAVLFAAIMGLADEVTARLVHEEHKHKVGKREKIQHQ